MYNQSLIPIKIKSSMMNDENNLYIKIYLNNSFSLSDEFWVRFSDNLASSSNSDMIDNFRPYDAKMIDGRNRLHDFEYYLYSNISESSWFGGEEDDIAGGTVDFYAKIYNKNSTKCYIEFSIPLKGETYEDRPIDLNTTFGDIVAVQFIYSKNVSYKYREESYSCSFEMKVGMPEKESTPPLNLTATLSDSKVTLSWNPPLDDGNATITEYRIYRGTSPNSLELIASVNGSVMEYLDVNVTKGETYYYSVSALNPIGESNLSEVVSIEIPDEKPQPTPSPGFLWIIGALSFTLLIGYRKRKKNPGHPWNYGWKRG